MRTYRRFLAVFFFLFTFHSFAQDTIIFTWKGGVNKSFSMYVPNGQLFTVNWGDGTIKTLNGEGWDGQRIYHTYTDTNYYTVWISANSTDYFFGRLNVESQQLSNLDVSKSTSLYYLFCFNNQLNTLNLSKNTALILLECQNNQLSNLVISTSTKLEHLYCYNNQLLLSDLYTVGQRVMYHPQNNYKWLGAQTLPIRQITVGDTIDFSSQARFGYNGNTPTDFLVTKDGQAGTLAIENVDYIIDSGIIVFLIADIYKLTMSNTAIASHQNFPAKVIAEFIVNERIQNIDASLASLTVSEGILEPDFHSDTLNYFVEVAYSVTNIDITATANDSLATVVGTWHAASLQIGDNIFTITVTAEDTTITQDYVITVHRKDTVTNIIEVTFTSYELRVYPNPTTGKIIIRHSVLNAESPANNTGIAGQARNDGVVIEIYNIVGKLQENRKSGIGKSEIEIDLSHLSAGLYFIKINNNKLIKIVKN